jgi:glycosyltransferase involved in cell wall biosynthesis
MARRLRVAHVITGLVLGGGGQVMWTIARNFDKSRFDADVFCVIGGGELVDDIEQLGMQVRIIPAHVGTSIFKYRPGQILELARQLRQGQYDVVHTHLFQADIIGGIAARLAGIRHVVKSLHNMGAWKKRHHLWIDRLLATDRVICCSEFLAESAIRQERLDPSRVVTIHHGVDTSRFRVEVARDGYLASLGLDPRKRLVGTIGRPIAEKGHEYLLSAIPRILAAHPDTQFLIVGEGALRSELQARIERMGLQHAVKLPGARGDVAELLSVMDVFVFPSVSEGLGIAILEAMAARVPIVASDIRPLSEMIVNGETGVFVEPRNPDALAAAVNGLLGDRSKAEGIRDRAFEHVSTRFSERQMVARIESVYNELCVKSRCDADLPVAVRN